MDKEHFDRLLESVQQMQEIRQGKRKPSRVFVYEEPDVRAVREQTGLSQSSFATMLGVSKRTLENWEQGRRRPTGPARVLLRIFSADPEHALRALHGNQIADGGKGG